MIFSLIHQVRLDGFRLAIQANITLADELNLICCFMWVTCKIEERDEADLSIVQEEQVHYFILIV